MAKRLFDSQLSIAESKPLGRKECYFEVGKDGGFSYGVRRADASMSPPVHPLWELPVGGSAGVKKPGSR